MHVESLGTSVIDTVWELCWAYYNKQLVPYIWYGWLVYQISRWSKRKLILGEWRSHFWEKLLLWNIHDLFRDLFNKHNLVYCFKAALEQRAMTFPLALGESLQALTDDAIEAYMYKDTYMLVEEKRTS